jgi:alpha-ketoglutarate-dependent taurine dioxygenase
VQVRWRWAAGDVAIWDEVATCHRALTDHFPQRRTMRRCVVEGDGPR